jgi:hypothetical protein
MSDKSPFPQFLHSDSDFEGLNFEDLVDYQDTVWEFIRWLYANGCGAQACRLEQAMRKVPPLSEQEATAPEPEMEALKFVGNVLDEIMIVPPRGLT